MFEGALPPQQQEFTFKSFAELAPATFAALTRAREAAQRPPPAARPGFADMAGAGGRPLPRTDRVQSRASLLLEVGSD
jgi:hypothetical protein